MSATVTCDDFLEDNVLRLSPDNVTQLEAALDASDEPPAVLVELVKAFKQDRTTQQLNVLQFGAADVRQSDFVLLQ